jgi:hypothetical protein
MVWYKCIKKPITVEYREVNNPCEEIYTREGILYAHRDEDYIIRGIDGELYPIKKNIFIKTYDIIE